MQSLVQARRQSEGLGDPIFVPLQGLREHEIHFRRGQVSLIASGPGAGKSLLMQAMAHIGNGVQKNTVLYFSADSGPEVMHERAAALSTDLDTQTIREMVENGNTAVIDAAVAAKHSHVTYSFRGSPTPEYITDELTAYVELHGYFPEVIVMDNLKDLVDAQDPDETRATEDAVMFLKDMARDTGAAVITLHHVGGPWEDAQQAIPLSGLRQKVGKTPALVITIYKPDPERLHLSVVKNRNGKNDTSGNFYVPVEVNASRMEFRG